MRNDTRTRIECPVLGLFGGADPGIPQEDVDRFQQGLQEMGVPNEIVVYPGAPHSFFDRKANEFATASADAWNRVHGFIADKGRAATAHFCCPLWRAARLPMARPSPGNIDGLTHDSRDHKFVH